MANSWASPRRTRTAFIVLLLLVTLLLAIMLAAQAIFTSRYHQTTAEGVLRDYARLAAGQYAARASQDLFYDLVSPSLQRLARIPAGPLPSRASHDLIAGSRPRLAGILQLDSLNRIQLVSDDSLRDWSAWIRDTILQYAGGLDSTAQFGGIVAENDSRGFLLIFAPRSEPARAIRGFLIDLSALAPILRRAAERAPLLPPSLTGGVRHDSTLVSLRVTSPGGTVLLQSEPAYPSAFAAWDSTGDYIGRFPVHAALRADLAGSLIIGGLPRSRLPLLVGLLVLTIALIVAALLLLRREAELGRLRADFVSGVSHELRTPLAQIRMFAETLQLGRIRSEDEGRRSLSIVDQEARRLTHLVENLLYFSRSERQQPRVAPQPISLVSVVNEGVESFRPLAAARGMRLEVRVDTEVSALIDPDAARQVLLNLLDNAAKYGPVGQTITVTIGQRSRRAALTVEDEGPGIPPPDRRRIWDRFWRLQRDRESNVAGTGIGLAIVRELALLHGGAVMVESTPTGSARFIVVLGEVVSPERPG